MHLFNQFQVPIINAIQRQYPDIKINPKIPNQSPIRQLYNHTHNAPLSIGQLRYVSQAISQINPIQANTIANKILQFMTNLISILQNNQQCRLSWTVGTIRGRVQKQSKINLPELQKEINTLNQLIEQCKHGVKCKSQFINLLNSRRKQIFRQIDISRLQKNIKQLYLPQMPQNYQNLQLLNQDSYQLIYQSIMQKLLIYQNAITQYLNRQLTFVNFQQICYQLMRQDIVLINNNKTNELIKYTWIYCMEKYYKFNRIKNRIVQLRLALIHSIIRCYYVAFIAEKEIDQLNQSLQRVQREIIGINTEKHIYNLGRNSVKNGSNIQEIVIRLQNNFTNIFNYLTDKNEGIFIQFYQKKLVKRVVKLFKIEDKLTHFFKIIFNPDYADQNKAKARQNNNQIHNKIDKKLSDLRQLFTQMKPINQKSFKIIFTEIQQLSIYIQQQNGGKEWQYKLSQFQKIVLNEYLFDQRGQRRIQKDSPIKRFANSRVNDMNKSAINDYNKYGTNWQNKSGVNEHNRSFNSLQVTKDQVFQDSMQQYKFKKTQSQIQPRQEEVDKQETYRQGKQYLFSIRPQFGDQFMDLVNCKAYLLPKLIKKAEIALSKTPYSQQPLYLYLVSLAQNLNLLQSLIKPQINQKKLHLIFYPKINSNLFSILKSMIAKHQQDVSQIYVVQTSDPIKAKNLPQNIKLFMQRRLRFIHIILDNLNKIQNLVISIDNLSLRKHNYDIANQATYNLILKLLLAQKQIKANRQAIKDQITNKDPSVLKAFHLLSEVIYPNFINSLLLIFENNKQINVLQTLLDLCDNSNKLITQSQMYFETILKMVEDIVIKRNASNFRNILQEWDITLRSFNSKIEQLINGCNNYSCINADALARQRIRIVQFIELIQNGSNTRADIIDDKSIKFRNFLKQIPS